MKKTFRRIKIEEYHEEEDEKEIASMRFVQALEDEEDESLESEGVPGTEDI